jgi:hypothetical protein
MERARVLDPIAVAPGGVHLLEDCATWLIMPSVSQRLAAMGYDPWALLHAAEEATKAWDNAERDSSSSSSLIATLVEKLQAAGEALASIAVRGVCNNPFCENVGGAAEQGIVTGKGHKCSGCRTAYYCSPRCQRLSWPKHKAVCKALAAAGSRRAG